MALPTEPDANPLPPTPQKDSYIVAEFTALREEILQRMRSEEQLMALAIVALGTLVAAGVQFNPFLILTYPFVATALAATWAAEDRGIQHVGQYIREKLEEQKAGLDALSWEHFIGAKRKFKDGFRNSVRLLFLSTEILALFLAASLSKDIRHTIDLVISGVFGLQEVTLDGVILILGAISVLITVWVMRFRDDVGTASIENKSA